MKVLLDENLAHRLRKRLGKHEVFTVDYMGWAGLKNGELLRIAEENGVEVFVTGDQNIFLPAEHCRPAQGDCHAFRNRLRYSQAQPLTYHCCHRQRRTWVMSGGGVRQVQ